MKTAHKDVDLKSRHVTPADGNVFADLGFSPKEAKALLKDADARIAKAQRLKEEAAKAVTETLSTRRLPNRSQYLVRLAMRRSIIRSAP